ncbi:MAG: hypothetical protein JXP73_05720 [Deltaproteobacteria bacterium]|nr:hypothetical protein [Deltaproteobacteria bacterium]
MIETPRPDAICDALVWARYDGQDLLAFARRDYVQQGSFWLRRDSPHVRWDRLPPAGP